MLLRGGPAVMLQSPADYDAFRNATKANRTPRIEARHESEAVEEGYQTTERNPELRQLLRRHDHGDWRDSRCGAHRLAQYGDDNCPGTEANRAQCGQLAAT
jgi:hypothetical protein